MICPKCEGSKEMCVFACGTRSTFRVIPCVDCCGTGEVVGYWPDEGQALRNRRVDGTPYRSLGRESRRLGIDVAVLSRMERGLVDPMGWPKGLRGEVAGE